MVIAPAFVQNSIPVATTLDAQYALITGAPSETGVSEITTAVALVKTAIGNFAADGAGAAGDKFAESKFDENGDYNSASGTKTGKDFTDDVTAKVKALSDAVAKKWSGNCRS